MKKLVACERVIACSDRLFSYWSRRYGVKQPSLAFEKMCAQDAKVHEAQMQCEKAHSHALEMHVLYLQYQNTLLRKGIA